MPYIIQQLPFTLPNLPIDFKKLDPNEFSWATFDSEPKVELTPDSATGYIWSDLSGKLHLDVNDTSVINVGVGQGKTTAMYRIAEHYASLENCVVIVASPFKKLVRRDFQKLSENSFKVISYENLESEEPRNLIDAKIHVITINCLLGNPGEDNFEVKFVKKEYLKLLREYCIINEKKVIFLFDEVHASIENFNRKFIYNLRAWKIVTHKCFIASATFTEAANIVIEYISFLTDYKLKLFEAPREKLTTQSNLHLYITDENYSANNFKSFEELIVATISRAIDNDKRVHIITAYKATAEYLYNRKNASSSELNRIISEDLRPRLLTGDTEEEFDEEYSSIGTTFYTGISITNENAILIILLPSATGENSTKFKGIFTDGKIAIVQAMARMRSASEIYVFMPKPNLLIEGTYINELGEGFRNLPIVHLYSEGEQRRLISDFYNEEKEAVRDFIVEGEMELSVRNENSTNLAPINYPTLGEFILERSSTFLASRYESFGRNCSVLMFWASLNNQFVNCTLQSLTYIQEDVYDLCLNRNTIRENLMSFFGEEIHRLIRGKTFHEAFEVLLQALATKEVHGRTIAVNIWFRKESNEVWRAFPNIATLPKEVFKTLVEILYSLGNDGERLTISEREYVFMRMETFGDCEPEEPDYSLPLIVVAYGSLFKIYEELKQISSENSNKIKLSDFSRDSPLLKAIVFTGVMLNQEDDFLKNGIYSIFRFDTKPTYKEDIERFFSFGAETPLELSAAKSQGVIRRILNQVIALFAEHGITNYNPKDKSFNPSSFVEFPYPHRLPRIL